MTSRLLRHTSIVLGLVSAACGADATARTAGAPAAIDPPSRASPATHGSVPHSQPSTPPRITHPDAAGIYARMKDDFAACFAQGKKATPEMTDGKLTLHASIDASGKTTCVIPSDATGITQEVQDCMSAKLAAQSFDAGGAWSARVPVAVRASAVQLGEASVDVARIDSIETLRMPDAYEILEAMVPELAACVNDVDRIRGVHSMFVGARVGADGRPQCALASSAGSLQPEIADCAAGVLRRAKFPPPKKGSGMVLIPINLIGQ